MKPEITLEESEFHEALKLAAKHSKREIGRVVASQGLALALEALKHTPKAKAADIERELGRIIKTSTSKTGRKTKKKTLHKNSLARNIVLSVLRNMGATIPPATELDRIVDRFINARKSAAGFISSGWIWAIRALNAKIKGQAVMSTIGLSKLGVKIKGSPKGGATFFEGASGSAVEVFNTSLLRSGHGDPMKVAKPALLKAMRIVAANMREHVRKKLSPIARQVNAK